ncbi:hypothetical protein MTR_6g037160 [Medicago truncatula]|uniref:Uncharacterized protein n=1 Tax=Medicago truncatula TaxID=3880 RepID=A0A072U826_MEDTR|nr:hypothetical protein MTR_6g037160 [Medicago truncatula]
MNALNTVKRVEQTHTYMINTNLRLTDSRIRFALANWREARLGVGEKMKGFVYTLQGIFDNEVEVEMLRQ